MVAAALCAFVLSGAGADSHRETAQPFSETELERFIADWPGFVAASRDGHDARDRHDPRDRRYARASEEYLISRDWQPQRFLDLAGSVTEGLIALEREDQAEAVAVELEQRRRVIMESPDLTPQQQALMIASLDRTLEEVRGDHSLSDAELALIRRHRDRLSELIDAIY